MRDPLLVPDLRELIQSGEREAVREFVAEHHSARIAEMIEDLGPGEGDAILAMLEPRARAEVLSYLSPEAQVRIVEAMDPSDAAALLHLMPHDDRADLVNRLDEDRVDTILRRLAHAEREDIRRLASFEAGTVGSVMTTDYATLLPHQTVREAIVRLRREAPDRETIDPSFVIDPQRRLLGQVSLKQLFLTDRMTARVEDIMQKDLVAARLDEDQESVARKIAQYDLIAIPVIDADDRLVGIVTHDDAADILRQEQTEDFLAFGGVARDPEADEETYWQGRIIESVRRRIGWLVLLFIGGLGTRFVVHGFDWVDETLRPIDFDAFIPLLIGTGGNAGSQTVGTIIRGLALGEIQRQDTGRVVARELLTGVLLGTLLGCLGFLFTWGVLGERPTFGAVIGLAILGICMWANVVGALVPLLVKRLGFDPALVSAPLISTFVDTTGLVIFYMIAILLLLKLAA